MRLQPLLGLTLSLAISAPANAATLADKLAPALSARLLDGSDFRLADHRGEVVILNFWATWCAPCRAELPAFDALYREHESEGLTVLAVSNDDPEQLARVREIAGKLAFPVAMAGDTLADGYGRIWRLPITFVIDRAGVLRVDGGAGMGEPKSYTLPELEQLVAPLLAPAQNR